jgi:hypothetical protein
MINLGPSYDVEHWPDNWTATTLDGRFSAQFEETLLYAALSNHYHLTALTPATQNYGDGRRSSNWRAVRGPSGREVAGIRMTPVFRPTRWRTTLGPLLGSTRPHHIVAAAISTNVLYDYPCSHSSSQSIKHLVCLTNSVIPASLFVPQRHTSFSPRMRQPSMSLVLDVP